MSSSSLGTPFSSSITDAFAHNLQIDNSNVQSFLTKKDILYADLNNFDIIIFTEPWLSSTVVDTDDVIEETIPMEVF
ncbi:hypothetical protein DPMN_040972 [Dreissena polymorpha]|uniref:Uncharacterized protein n=1 Tax=Dreissena polymorpha TaxID=45954 RepID=A0A9D4CW21_DREPO|nr:hypothetical protein DPMN_040972 [Dreissena polymorpha]